MRRVRVYARIVDGGFALFVQGDFNDFIQNAFKHRFKRLGYAINNARDSSGKPINHWVKNRTDGSADDSNDALNERCDERTKVESCKVQVHNGSWLSIH